jgi:hypothetical protein
MATSRPRLHSLAAIIVGCGLGAVSVASQSAPAPAYPNAPAGFDVRQSGIQAGRLERVEYDSKVTGNRRPAIVYRRRATLPRASTRCCTCCMELAATKATGRSSAWPT